MQYNNNHFDFAIGILETNISAQEANRLALEGNRVSLDDDPDFIEWGSAKGWTIETYAIGEFTHVMLARNAKGVIVTAQKYETVLTAEVA
jgi:hypothetical protein